MAVHAVSARLFRPYVTYRFHNNMGLCHTAAMATTPGPTTDGRREPVLSERREAATPADGTGPDLLVPPKSDQRPEISVVLPTLNEEGGVRECIDQIRTALRELDVRGEVIVSDSSTDRTPDIAREEGAIVVSPETDGYGAAYKCGFRATRGRYIAIGDADTTYDFTELPKLYHSVVAGDADIAMGSRLAGTIEPGAMPSLHRYIGNPLLTRLLNALYGTDVSDAHSGLRVISRSALGRMNLRTDGMEFASEMVMEAGAKGLVIEERPITYHERVGEATLDSFSDGWRHVRFMLLNAPRHTFSLPGMALCALGLLSVAAAAVAAPAARVGISGVGAMIVGGLLLVSGSQAVSFGAIASVATNPIRPSEDPLTTFLTGISVERGLLLGAVPIAVGVGSLARPLSAWVAGGFGALSVTPWDAAAFVGMVLGFQMVLGTGLLGMVRDGRSVRDGGSRDGA